MIYLDNSATTPPFDTVIEAMAQCMRETFYNPSSPYAPAIGVQKSMYNARKAILRLLFANDYTLTFTSGGTEANNLALLGVAQSIRGSGHFVTTRAEHPSVGDTIASLASAHQVSVLPVDFAGQVDMDALDAVLLQKPTLISIMHVNNETGAVANLEQIGMRIKAVNPDTLFHVDGVQGFLRQPLSLSKAMIDLYSLSGHKIHGPKGIGALVCKKGVRLHARQHGGGQENALRGGTENIPGIFGLSAAIGEFAQNPTWAKQIQENKLFLYQNLKASLPEMTLNGPSPEAGAVHILNVSFPHVRGEVMLHALEAKGILVSTGSACSSRKRKTSHVLAAMGVAPTQAEGALRFSLSPLTQRDELKTVVDEIVNAYQTLRVFTRK